MRLYYSPGACSLASHIVLRESGLPFELERVDLRARRTESGADFTAINAKGYVPALALDGGELLTEGPAILQYVADQAESLAPAAGGLDRYRVQEWLNFVGTELHKGISPLFKPDTPEEYKTICLSNVTRRLETVAAALEGRDYLLGKRFSSADAYLFVVLSWLPKFGIDLGRWPAIAAFMSRVQDRPAVREARAAEGLS